MSSISWLPWAAVRTEEASGNNHRSRHNLRTWIRIISEVTAIGVRNMLKQIDYTMVIVSDMNRSVEFYRDKLGIPLKFESPDWTEFQTGATTLALHGGGIREERRGALKKLPEPVLSVLTCRI